MDLCRTQEIVDVIHGAIAYSGMEEAVIGTPIFNRLHRILQSSMVYLTFPSNKVKRFEHSLGVMYIAGEFFARWVGPQHRGSLQTSFRNGFYQIPPALSVPSNPSDCN